MSFPSLTSFGGTRRFGVDSYTMGASLPVINELADGITGFSTPKWNGMDPVPIGSPYPSLATIAAQIAAIHALGRAVHVTMPPDHETALDTGAGTFLDPGTGDPHAKWWRIKPEHLANWPAFITHFVTNSGLQAGDVFQIGNETYNSFQGDEVGEPPEDLYRGAIGFAEIVRLAKDAVHAVNPHIRLAAFGLGFGSRFQYSPTPAQGVQLWVQAFLDNVAGRFDILTLHHGSHPSFIAPTVEWVRNEMLARGYGRPIWFDDVLSGIYYQAEWASQTDIDWIADAENWIAADIVDWEARQARCAIEQSVCAFAAGAERVLLQQDVNFAPGYHIPIYTHMGFLKTSGARKPVFYAYQQLIRAIDGFRSATKLGADEAYKFTFPAKDDVVVAWAAAPGAIDLSAVFSGTVRATTVVTTLSGTVPIQPADWVGDADEVPVDVTPVIVVGA